MAEYKTLEFVGKQFATGGGTDWTPWNDLLNGHAEEGWRVHTTGFPAPGRAVALLVRDQAPRAAGVLVTDTDGDTWGTCVVCQAYGSLNAQRVCGDHASPMQNNTPQGATTYPRKVPR